MEKEADIVDLIYESVRQVELDSALAMAIEGLDQGAQMRIIR